MVKVIAGQLQDLNQVLEDTKESQVMQSQTSDQVLDSLKQELNKAKIELVVALEEKEKLQDDFSDRIKNLELQLEDAQNEVLKGRKFSRKPPTSLNYLFPNYAPNSMLPVKKLLQ